MQLTGPSFLLSGVECRWKPARQLILGVRRLEDAMRKRRTLMVLAALAGLASLAGVIVIVCSLPKRAEASLTTIVRLTPGMSQADVAAALGPPAADVTARPPPGTPSPAPGGRLLEYVGELATARVEFDADGRLVRCHPAVHTVTGLERIRLRLNWW
jgi:hypothetical protein